MASAIEADALRAIGRHLHRPGHPVTIEGTQASPQGQPQESRMTSRIADAKAAVDHAQAQLAAVPQNALADAIADEGAGLTFGPPEISLVLAVIHGIEHGPGATLQPAQQTIAGTRLGAADVTPQQPV